MHPPLSYNNNYLVAGVCGVSLRGVSLGRKSRQMESNVVDTCCRNRADLVSSLKATLILCCRQSPKIHSHIWVQRSLAILQKVHGEFFPQIGAVRYFCSHQSQGGRLLPRLLSGRKLAPNSPQTRPRASFEWRKTRPNSPQTRPNSPQTRPRASFEWHKTRPNSPQTRPNSPQGEF